MHCIMGLLRNKSSDYTMLSNSKDKKAWIVAVDMGYGHQRTAYPLRSLAFGGKVLNANNYPGIPLKEKKFWDQNRYFYEFISRFRRVPLLGNLVFSLMDRFQKIMSYYPKRNLSASNLNLRGLMFQIKRGWGKDLIEKLKRNPLPLISTFFSPAFMAETFNYPGEIYCVICDADIARAWVPPDPEKSRIKYFASCTWSRDRLKLYGVKPENVILTGYPLPKENVGQDMEIVKHDLRYRILNLDPIWRYRTLYGPMIKGFLGELPQMPNHPLTMMFSIGGAGAQKEIAAMAVNSLKEKIKNKELRVIISVGTHHELKEYFANHVRDLQLDGWIHILSGNTINEYFEKFNQALRTTDILWTKPSELSFYGALGIPIIIAPPLGSQEDFNKRWILHIGAGTEQGNMQYTDQWLFDMLNTGDLAEMAMQGFIEMEKMGTYKIESIINQ